MKYNNQSFIEVIFPNTLEEIGLMAFYNCIELQSLTFPPSLLLMEQGKYTCCTSLRTVSFYDDLKKILKEAFSGCILIQNISLPHSVEQLGESSFLQCYGLTSLTFGSKIDSIT
jgi:hypothetical protein